jgi:hypothetical protein
MVLAGVTAAASAAPPIEVVSSAADAPLADRVAADLRSMGLEAERGQLPPGDVALLDLARSRGALAAVRILRTSRGLEVWVAERATGKTLMRVAPLSPEDGESMVALRAVELLRASLLELDLGEEPRGDIPEASADALRAAVAPAPAPRATAAPPPLPARVATSEPQPAPPVDRTRATTQDRPSAVRGSLEVGPAVVGSPGGLPPFAAATGVVGLWVAEQVRIGVVGWVPLHAMFHEAVEGESDTRIHALGVEVRYEVAVSERWRPSIAVSGMALFAETEGRPSSLDHVGRTDHDVGLGPTVRPGIAWHLGEHVALRGDATVGTVVRPFAITYGDRQGAQWGRVWLGGSLTVEGTLPFQ